MSAKILPLPGVQAPRQEIGHYLRIGYTGHKQLEMLQANGRLPARKIVVEAAKLKFQKDLVAALRGAGCQIVLDTNAAQLSALGLFAGAVRSTPWASVCNGSPLQPKHFDGSGGQSVIEQIAQFAVSEKVDALLAPCHFLRAGHKDPWFEVDQNACVALRAALDRNGGGNIGLDYLLIPTYSHLHDEAERGAFLHALADLPFDNLWIRASGFGADASPLGTRRYLSALFGLHNLGKPVIADNLGGLVGLATVAFGAAGGIAHGVGEHERFNASEWDKPAKEVDPEQRGGPQIRIAVPGLGRSVTKAELEMLSKVRGGHRLVVCNDRACCLNGLQDMLKNWRSHFLYQRYRETISLEGVPDHNRTRHFLDTTMTDADRLARQIKSLKIPDPKLSMRLSDYSRRVESIRSALENLAEARAHSTARALPPVVRRNSPEGHRSEK